MWKEAGRSSLVEHTRRVAKLARVRSRGVGGSSEAHVFYLSMSLRVGHFSIYVPPRPWGPLHSIYLCRNPPPPEFGILSMYPRFSKASEFYLSMSKPPPPDPPEIWNSIYLSTAPLNTNTEHLFANNCTPSSSITISISCLYISSSIQ